MTGWRSGVPAELLLGAGDDVADRDVVLEIAKDLLAAGEAALADRKLHAALAAEFRQLVDDVERRRVAGDGEVGADAESVDRRAARRRDPGSRIHPARRSRRSGLGEARRRRGSAAPSCDSARRSPESSRTPRTLNASPAPSRAPPPSSRPRSDRRCRPEAPSTDRRARRSGTRPSRRRTTGRSCAPWCR